MEISLILVQADHSVASGDYGLKALCKEIEVLLDLEKDSILPKITLGDRNILRAEMPRSAEVQSKLGELYEKMIEYIRSLKSDRGIVVRFAFQAT